MKYELYLYGFILIFVCCNIYLTYKVIHVDCLEKSQKLYQILITWLIPYIGFFIVFYMLKDDFNDSNKKNRNSRNDNSVAYEVGEAVSSSGGGD